MHLRHHRYTKVITWLKDMWTNGWNLWSMHSILLAVFKCHTKWFCIYDNITDEQNPVFRGHKMCTYMYCYAIYGL